MWFEKIYTNFWRLYFDAFEVGDDVFANISLNRNSNSLNLEDSENGLVPLGRLGSEEVETAGRFGILNK